MTSCLKLEVDQVERRSRAPRVRAKLTPSVLRERVMTVSQTAQAAFEACFFREVRARKTLFDPSVLHGGHAEPTAVGLMRSGTARSKSLTFEAPLLTSRSPLRSNAPSGMEIQRCR